MKDVEGTVVELIKLVAEESQKMLGVWLAPDGNNDKQVVEIRQSSIE